MIYYWFLLGVVVGSFLNVCIHRLPRGESLVFPASRCPVCNSRLSVLDLIPILGYFILRGRCRYCSSKISFRYPAVELLSGIIFALLWQQNAGDYFDFAFQAFFACLLIVVSFIDLELRVIPDSVSVAGIIAGLAYNFLAFSFFGSSSGQNRIISSFGGMIFGYLTIWSIGKFGEILFKKEAMGEGDLLLAAMLGAYLGWRGVLVSIFLAFFLSALFCVFLMILKRIKFGQYVPFAPALAAAGFIYLFWGEMILSWYLNLLV